MLGCTGSGSWSGVIAGIDWAASHHDTGPAVANMSLGGSPNRSVDKAVQRLVEDGVSVAVAAGNDNRDACSYSPARVSTVLTTGATTENDSRASFSNYGSCLDLFAPGVNITSAWNTGATGSNTISGTSMATPHVAGTAAVLLTQNPALKPSEVASQLTGASTTNVITNAGTRSPNRLLYVRPISRHAVRLPTARSWTRPFSVRGEHSARRHSAVAHRNAATARLFARRVIARAEWVGCLSDAAPPLPAVAERDAPAEVVYDVVAGGRRGVGDGSGGPRDPSGALVLKGGGAVAASDSVNDVSGWLDERLAAASPDLLRSSSARPNLRALMTGV